MRNVSGGNEPIDDPDLKSQKSASVGKIHIKALLTAVVLTGLVFFF
jgi:hypothetical protein